jgi:hypothetical protein
MVRGHTVQAFGRAAIVALLLWACGESARPSSFRELAERFERAHRAEDLAALRSLVCWDGADADVQGVFDRQATADFGREIGSVFAEDLAANDDTSGEPHRAGPCPGLRPIGVLRVTFVPPAGTLAAPSRRYLFGTKAGEYLLVPVPTTGD